jgi:hypothetical protein
MLGGVGLDLDLFDELPVLRLVQGAHVAGLGGGVEAEDALQVADVSLVPAPPS